MRKKRNFLLSSVLSTCLVSNFNTGMRVKFHFHLKFLLGENLHSWFHCCPAAYFITVPAKCTVLNSWVLVEDVLFVKCLAEYQIRPCKWRSLAFISTCISNKWLSRDLRPSCTVLGAKNLFSKLACDLGSEVKCLRGSGITFCLNHSGLFHTDESHVTRFSDNTDNTIACCKYNLQFGSFSSLTCLSYPRLL